jgi:hypothetical protein
MRTTEVWPPCRADAKGRTTGRPSTPVATTSNSATLRADLAPAAVGGGGGGCIMLLPRVVICLAAVLPLPLGGGGGGTLPTAW